MNSIPLEVFSIFTDARNRASFHARVRVSWTSSSFADTCGMIWLGSKLRRYTTTPYIWRTETQKPNM